MIVHIFVVHYFVLYDYIINNFAKYDKINVTQIILYYEYNKS